MVGELLTKLEYGLQGNRKTLEATRNRKGLKVRAALDRRNYPKGIKVTKAEMADLEGGPSRSRSKGFTNSHW
jgi:hypothetical protein